MQSLSGTEIALGIVIMKIFDVIILFFIVVNIKMAADSKVKEAERSADRKAERLAKEIIRQRFGESQIQVTQRIVVIEDDLKGGMK